MSDEIKLKPRPACGEKSQYTGENNSPLIGAVRCTNYLCNIIGPRNDPTGEKWNALPRKEGTTHCVRCSDSAVLCDPCAHDMYYAPQLTLRDRFMLAALGWLVREYGLNCNTDERNRKLLAQVAYDLAEACLDERNKKGGE